MENFLHAVNSYVVFCANNSEKLCGKSYLRLLLKITHMAFEWKGVFPALLTPFTKDDTLDLVMYEKNLAGSAWCRHTWYHHRRLIRRSQHHYWKRKKSWRNFLLNISMEEFLSSSILLKAPRRMPSNRQPTQLSGALMGWCYYHPCGIKRMTGKRLLSCSGWIHKPAHHDL